MKLEDEFVPPGIGGGKAGASLPVTKITKRRNI